MDANSKRKVMVIDDDQDHLQITRKILETKGFEVSTFGSCEDLVPNIKKFAPGVIFMDVAMSDLSGPEATEMLKSDSRWKDIPIVLFSGAHNLPARAAESGADGWFAKPFTADGLVACAERYSSNW